MFHEIFNPVFQMVPLIHEQKWFLTIFHSYVKKYRTFRLRDVINTAESSSTVFDTTQSQTSGYHWQFM